MSNVSVKFQKNSRGCVLLYMYKRSQPVTQRSDGSASFNSVFFQFFYNFFFRCPEGTGTEPSDLYVTSNLKLKKMIPQPKKRILWRCNFRSFRVYSKIWQNINIFSHNGKDRNALFDLLFARYAPFFLIWCTVFGVKR